MAPARPFRTFAYEEQANSEGFFLPYVWDIATAVVGDGGDDDDIDAFNETFNADGTDENV